MRVIDVSELTEWSITLVDGVVVDLLADSYGQEGEDYVFDLFVPGQPPTLADAVRISQSAVREIEGGRLPSGSDGVGDSLGVSQSRIDSVAKWEIKLSTGGRMELNAHSLREDDEALVFCLRLERTPPMLFELARVPRRVVRLLKVT